MHPGCARGVARRAVRVDVERMQPRPRSGASTTLRTARRRSAAGGEHRRRPSDHARRRQALVRAGLSARDALDRLQAERLLMSEAERRGFASARGGRRGRAQGARAGAARRRGRRGRRSATKKSAPRTRRTRTASKRPNAVRPCTCSPQLPRERHAASRSGGQGVHRGRDRRDARRRRPRCLHRAADGAQHAAVRGSRARRSRAVDRGAPLREAVSGRAVLDARRRGSCPSRCAPSSAGTRSA